MWQFIILGYVPGTNIQITFSLLAQVAGIGAVAYLIWLIKKEEKFVQNQLVNLLNQKRL